MKAIPVMFCISLFVGGALHAHTVPEVLAAIDPATGKPKDTQTVFTLTAIVSARALLPDGQVLAFVHPVGQRGLPVIASAADGARLLPRNEVSLTGTLRDGPYDWAVLGVKAGSITVSATNKPFGMSASRSASFFADPSGLAGSWVQVTNVTFAPGKLSVQAPVKVAGEDGGQVPLLLTTSVEGREAPQGKVNVFGVPLKVNGEWRLLAARFLAADGKTMQALAEKRTCLTCHTPDTLLVGPAYRDVAAKYRNDAEAVGKLVAQMENGGTGKWGTNVMVPLKAVVPGPEMKQLAEWILTYRWDALLAE